MTRIQYPVFVIQQASGEPALSSVSLGAPDGMKDPCVVLFEDADRACAVASDTGLREFTLLSIADQPELVKLLLTVINHGVYHAYVNARQEDTSRAFSLLDVLSIDHSATQR